MTDLPALCTPLIERYRLAGPKAVHTGIDGVTVFYQERSIERIPCVYSPGIFLIIRGRKMGYLGPRQYAYGNDRYLTLGLPLALECETFASPEEPLFAVYVAVTPGMVREIAGGMGLTSGEAADASVAMRSSPYSPAMQDAVGRLLRALASDEDTRILGDALVREIIYRALQGEGAEALRGMLAVDGATARIAGVMETMHTRFSERLSIDDLAGIAGMSASVFHRAFRQVADDTPLQYLKKVRLAAAGTMIARDACRVSVAASAVGYESAAHFSRDFKSHFGIPPADARKMGHAFLRAEMVP